MRILAHLVVLCPAKRKTPPIVSGEFSVDPEPSGARRAGTCQDSTEERGELVR